MIKKTFKAFINVLGYLLFGLFGFPLGTVDLSFDASAIKKYGGQKFAYKRVKVDGADLTVPDTWHTGVYKEKDSMKFEQPLEIYKDSSGAQVGSDYQEVSTSFEVTSMQDDADTENFIKDEVPLNYFAVFMEAGADVTGKVKERFIPITRWERKYNSESPGRRPQLVMIPQENASAVTPATVPTFAKGLAATYTVAAKAYYTAFKNTL